MLNLIVKIIELELQTLGNNKNNKNRARIKKIK